MPDQEQTRMQLDVCLAEYDKLKAEQTQRIGHRDNLVYATLVATAGVIAFAFKEDGDPIGLMVLPLACFVLGWLHTINDEKISSVGGYLRTTFRDRIRELTHDEHPHLLAWEGFVRADRHRRWRKTMQLVSNLVTFVAPGALALPAYWYLAGTRSWLLVTATIVEGIFLLILSSEIMREADIGLISARRKGQQRHRGKSAAQSEAPNPTAPADQQTPLPGR